MAYLAVGGAVVGVVAVPGALIFLLVASLSPLPAAPGVTGVTGAAVPGAVMAADRQASAAIGSIVTGCVVPVAVLLAVGQVESGNAAGHAISASGEVSPPIFGPPLGAALGRAMGPMQITPSTWQRWATSSTGGTPDPQNIDDAALTAAVVLCQPPANLSDPAQLGPALFSYNHSAAYVAGVESWAGFFTEAPAITPLTQSASS